MLFHCINLGKKIFPTNYRPISLLATMSKVLEKILYSRTYAFLNETCQLYCGQYGFRKNHSCKHTVQELVGNALKGLEKKEYTIAVYLDLSNAFDTLEHDVLLKKMELYGIRGIALNWYKSYLMNRKLSVKCVSGMDKILSYSDDFPVTYGVPQGSCLGPLLFLIFCNDLPLNLSRCNSILFADDTTLYKSHKNLRYLIWSVQEELKQLSKWFKSNKLTLNPEKCVSMLFGDNTNDKSLELELDGVQVKQVQYTKFLGVWIDAKLCWHVNFEKTIVKLKQNMNLLKIGKKFLNVRTKRLIYFAHIHSHITYCISVWGSLFTSMQLYKLECIQDLCVKLIDSRKSKKDLGILNINNLLELEQLKFCYKYLQDALPPNVSHCIGTDPYGNSLVKKHQYNTRNRNIPLKPKANCSLYRKSIFCMYLTRYVTLPAKIKCSKTMSHFIKQCKLWLIENNQ